MKEKRVKVTLTVWVSAEDAQENSQDQIARQCADVIEANEGWHVSDYSAGPFKTGRRDDA